MPARTHSQVIKLRPSRLERKRDHNLKTLLGVLVILLVFMMVMAMSKEVNFTKLY